MYKRQEQNLSVPVDDNAARILAQGVAEAGIHRLGFSKAQNQMRDRVQFLRAAEGAGSGWPDLSDAALATNAADWLGPYIVGRTSVASITADDLGQALQALMPWDLQRKMEGEAPTHFLTPAGANIALDYEAEGGPVLAVRVQEPVSYTHLDVYKRQGVPRASSHARRWIGRLSSPEMIVSRG